MRDITRKQFVAKMRAYGWRPEIDFMGYWYRRGLGVSELNYATRRQALAAFIKKGEEWDAKARKASATTD